MSLALKCEEPFKIIVRLRFGEPKGQTASQAKQSILSSLAAIEKSWNGESAKYSSDTFEDAKFALAAFADESATRSSSPLIKDAWKTPTTMVLQSFPTIANAGNEFYVRLKRISQQSTKEAGELLEVYCLCLTLGFMGLYSGKQLRDLTTETRNRVEQLLGTPPDLMVGLQALKEEWPAAHSHLPWVFAAIIVLIAAYVFFILNLSRSADRLSGLVTVFFA